MSLTHKYPECIGRSERHGSNGVLFWECMLCGAVGYERAEDAERISLKPEERVPLFTPAQQYNCREDLRAFAESLPKSGAW